MKKNISMEMQINNICFVYEDYVLKEKEFFYGENINVIPYEGFEPIKLLPLPKNLLFNHQLYVENKNGQVEPMMNNNEQIKYKNKAAYIVAKKAVIDLNQENFSQFQERRMTTDYNLNEFGRTLYTELAKWDFSNFQEIINFCKTWGLPTGVTLPLLEEKPLHEDINTLWMSIEDFYNKIIEYKKIYSYFKAITTDDYSELLSISSNRESFRTHAKEVLKEKITEKNTFSYKIQSYENTLLPTVSVFKDLFEVAYFSLSMAIFNGAEMRSCENCGHLFEVTHQRQRFCAVLPGRKRSSCEMAYNNRLKKEKKQKRN